MNELYREIEEDIRRERVQKLWHGFGKLMVAASVAVILFTAFVVIMQNHRQARATEQTMQLLQGIDRLRVEDYKGAIVALNELTADTGSSYYGLAMLRKAQAQTALGDRESAAKTYQELAKNDPVFGGLGNMLGNDASEPDPKSPFYFSQEEWNGWQLMQRGKKDEAVATFTALRDDAQVPYSMHQRMQEVVRFIAPGKSTMSDEPMKDERKE